ncbi:enolase C-terminal domain-like protein [Streptomyces sp. NPDC088847]|uniref:enolase C-terminal domain-like protein n=1 Tax=Streptomyces sp. NPDC088847 TaxID=3365909 RepID=UPI00381385F5
MSDGFGRLPPVWRTGGSRRACTGSAARAIRALADGYLGPLPLDRDPADIEDLHRLLLNSGYWRGGSISHNALAGIDVADIKGKTAGLPLYSLLGGRVRDAADAYTYVHGGGAGAIADRVLAAVEEDWPHVRVQVAVPGKDTYGTAPGDPTEARRRELRSGSWDSLSYLRHITPVLREIRERVSGGVELLHDAHARLAPSQARELVRALEEAQLFFLEDALAPENAAHFAQLGAARGLRAWPPPRGVFTRWSHGRG